MTDNINVKTYRFKFSPEVVKSLFEFSKLHQFEKRKDYKESWEGWVKENDELISTETRKLLLDGYNGNVLDKMYKSSRYYFRNKSTAKVDPKKRRKYSACNTEFIEIMDEYIVETFKKDKDFKPSDKYNSFSEKYRDTIQKEVNRFKDEGSLDEKEILDKIKKLFKNRYFQLIKNK